MYFKEFPRFLYDFKYGNETKTSVVVDVTRNVRFRKEIFANVAFYDEYDVIDGETPEIIAEKLYGNPEYHWILMIANGKYDYLTDWVKPEQACRRACLEEYNAEFTATSWAYSGTTITVTKASHGLLVSPTTTVRIEGATATTNAPNGTFTITAVTANTFSFVVASAPTGTAGGTVKVTPSGVENYIHHYENARGFVVNSNAPGAVSITNLIDSQRKNEAKRRIKIISPQLVNTILKNFKEQL